MIGRLLSTHLGHSTLALGRALPAPKPKETLLAGSELDQLGWVLPFGPVHCSFSELCYVVPAVETAEAPATDAGTLKATTGWVSPFRASSPSPRTTRRKSGS